MHTFAALRISAKSVSGARTRPVMAPRYQVSNQRDPHHRRPRQTRLELNQATQIAKQRHFIVSHKLYEKGQIQQDEQHRKDEPNAPPEAGLDALTQARHHSARSSEFCPGYIVFGHSFWHRHRSNRGRRRQSKRHHHRRINRGHAHSTERWQRRIRFPQPASRHLHNHGRRSGLPKACEDRRRTQLWRKPGRRHTRT
jgi:hypothetical protein